MTTVGGGPAVLRSMNDRAAVDLLLRGGPLSRAQLSEQTGLSKATAAQLLARLEQRGLVRVVGDAHTGRRGPKPALYGVPLDLGYVGAITVSLHEGITAMVLDLSGRELGRASAEADRNADPREALEQLLDQACRSAGVPSRALLSVAVSVPGVLDPDNGDVRWVRALPAWKPGLKASLCADLDAEVRFENDVNLAAVAEQRNGAGEGLSNFALFWLGDSIGMALIIDDLLVTGVSNRAGEIWALPVPGFPPPAKAPLPRDGAFYALTGRPGVAELGALHGLTGDSSGALVAAAMEQHHDAFLDELAARIAVGVAEVCVVADPGTVVLGGPMGLAGGDGLAERVQRAAQQVVPQFDDLVEVRRTVLEQCPILLGTRRLALSTAHRIVSQRSSDPSLDPDQEAAPRQLTPA